MIVTAVLVLMMTVPGLALFRGTAGLLEGNLHLLLTQLYGVAVTMAWSAGGYLRAPRTGQRLRPAAHIPAAGTGGPGYFAAWRGIAVDSLSKYRLPALAMSMIMSKYPS